MSGVVLPVDRIGSVVGLFRADFLWLLDGSDPTSFAHHMHCRDFD
jgi:hypothetical protein